MILGRDLLNVLVLDLRFYDNIMLGIKVPYEGCSAPMVDVSNYNFNIITAKTVKPEESFINSYVGEYFESGSAISATRRMRSILDAKDRKAYLNKVMTKQFQHLNIEERKILINILSKSEDLFRDPLGVCNTNQVYLELRENTKPVLLRPYPIPRLHKAMFIKEVEILVILGVLEEANECEWGAPLFAYTKAKTNCVRFLSDFRNLNRQLKRKPYPMTKIREMILNI